MNFCAFNQSISGDVYRQAATLRERLRRTRLHTSGDRVMWALFAAKLAIALLMMGLMWAIALVYSQKP